MNSSKTTCVCVGLMLIFALPSAAAEWTGESGYFSSAEIWKGGAVPLAGEDVLLSAEKEGVNTLSLAGDSSTAFARIVFTISPGARTVFDCGGYSLLMPDLPVDGVYAARPLEFRAENGVFFALTNTSATSAVESPLLWDKARVSVSQDAGNSLRAGFAGGTIDFYSPGGVAHPGRELLLGGAAAPASEVVFENETSSLPAVRFKCYAEANRLAFIGGRHSINGALGANRKAEIGDNCRKIAVEIDSAELSVSGDIALYRSKDYGSSPYAYEFSVLNGSTLTTEGSYYAYRSTNGITRLENSVWNALGKNAGSSTAMHIGYSDGYNYPTVQKMVALNSTLNIGRQHNYGNFAVGHRASVAKWVEGYFYATNCVINANAQFNIACGEAEFADCRFTGLNNARYGVQVTGDGTLTVDGDTYMTASLRTYIGSNTRRGPVLEIRGGTVKIYNQINVGDGADMPAGTVQTNIIRQTGGRIESNWVFLSYSAEPCRYILEGGTYAVKATVGSSGSKSQKPDKGGWSHFIGNGGVIEAVGVQKQNSVQQPLISGLDRCEAGERGLIVDDCGNEHFIRQDITDMPGVSGRFVKRGAGTIALYVPAKWDVSETAVEAGTLLVGADVESAVVLESDVRVRPGTVLSLEGAASSLTVDSLALTNATLVLDPGDTLRVRGPLELDRLTVRFTSNPTERQLSGFLTVESPLSPETKRQLEFLRLEGVEAADGMLPVPGFTTDGDGHAVWSVEMKDAAEVNGSSRWNGGSGGWEEESLWSAGVPGAASKAVFADSGDSTVAVASAAETGAIELGGGDRVFSGPGSVVLGAYGGSFVNVLAGTHRFDVPVVSRAPFALDTAAGAEVAFAGGVSAAGFSKTGTGRVVLSGDSFFGGDIALKSGKMTLAGDGAIRGAAVRLGDGTLQVAPDCRLPPFALVLASTNTKGAVVVDNASDITVDDFKAESGALIKRGAGTMTIDVSKGCPGGLAAGTGGHANDGLLASANRKLFAFADDGTPPAFGFGGFNVAGGELVVRGNGGAVSCKGAIHVGLRTSTDCGVQPSLTLDNVEVDALTGVNYQHLTIGFNTADAGNFTSNPVVRVINDSKLYVWSVNMGYPYENDATRTGARLEFAVTNSLVRAYDQFGFSQLRGNAGVARLLAYGATLNASWYEISGNTDSRITASTISSRTGDHVKISGDCYGSGTVLFDGGTLLKVNSLAFNHESVRYARMLTFAFDDATWDSGPGGIALDETTFTGYLAFRRFEMRGKGLTLPVAEGAVFRSDALFFGSGDLVKTGAGTLSFGEGAFALGGTVRVREGVLDLSDAGTVTNAAFAGPGTVRGASFGEGARIEPSIGADWSSVDVPVFENCSFGGRIYVEMDPSLAARLELPSAEGVAVAKFTGAPPDVSRWRVRNVWNEPGVRGRFALDGDTVRMTVARTGFSIIIR